MSTPLAPEISLALLKNKRLYLRWKPVTACTDGTAVVVSSYRVYVLVKGYIWMEQPDSPITTLDGHGLLNTCYTHDFSDWVEQFVQDPLTVAVSAVSPAAQESNKTLNKLTNSIDVDILGITPAP